MIETFEAELSPQEFAKLEWKRFHQTLTWIEVALNGQMFLPVGGIWLAIAVYIYLLLCISSISASCREKSIDLIVLCGQAVAVGIATLPTLYIYPTDGKAEQLP